VLRIYGDWNGIKVDLIPSEIVREIYAVSGQSEELIFSQREHDRGERKSLK